MIALGPAVPADALASSNRLFADKGNQPGASQSRVDRNVWDEHPLAHRYDTRASFTGLVVEQHQFLRKICGLWWPSVWLTPACN